MSQEPFARSIPPEPPAAEAKAEARKATPPATDRPASAAAEVLAMAERIQDVAWTMRERGIDPRTCEQIETLAATIMSASALRDPNDQRARKLGEVLRYLERRLDAMLDACAAQAQQTPQPPGPPAADSNASAPDAGNWHDVDRKHDAVAASPMLAAAPSEATAANAAGTPAPRDAAEPTRQMMPPRADPLAALKALSDAERIALFT